MKETTNTTQTNNVDELRRKVKLLAAAQKKGIALYKPTESRFLPWLKKHDSKSSWEYSWHPLVVDKLQRAVDNPIRLAIMLPPRSGKSHLASIRFPVYFLDRRPDAKIISIAYSALLSTKFSREARELARGIIPLNQNKQSALDWETLFGGNMFAAGIGGSLTGRGGHLLLADDLIQNIEVANSANSLDKIWDSFAGDFLSRGEPGYSVVVVSTRWAIDDVIGRLLNLDKPEWEFIDIKAIAEENDPLGRPPGQVLNPERYTLEDLRELEELMGKRIFRSLYQNDPSIPGGNLLKADLIIPWDVGKPLPRFEDLVLYWDTSGGENDAQTAGVLMGRYKKDYIIIDVAVGKWVKQKRMELMVGFTNKCKNRFDGNQLRVYVEQQGGSAGKETVNWEKSEFMKQVGIIAKSDSPTGSKVERAIPFAGMIEGGNHVYILQEPWTQKYLVELANFPFGTTKDMVDASTGAFGKLYRKITSGIF